MSRYERVSLSASTDWKGILLTKVATPGDVLHIPTGLSDVIDEIYLWAENPTAGMLTVTVEFGGVGAGDLMVREIPAKQAIQIVKGRPLKGAFTVAAFASAVGSLNVWGYINRIIIE